MAFSLAGLAPLAGLASGYQQGMDWRQQQALRGLAIQQAQLANQQAQEQQQVLPTIYAAAQQLGSLQGLQGLPQQPSPPPPTTGDTTVPAPAALSSMPASSAMQPLSSNAIQLAQNFTSQGYPPAAAAGLVGALTGESGSGLNPQAVGDSGAGVGIASWEGPRRAALQRLPAPQSFPTQARFAASELAPSGPEARTGQALRNFIGTPQQAAALATTGYLRPNQNAPGYAASMQQRQQAAQQVYQALGGQPTDAQAQPLAQAVGAQVPPQMQGMAQLGQLAQLIERTAAPGTPDNVKAMALFQLHQMLAPDQKQMLALQLQVFKDQMRFETDTEIARMRSQQPPTAYQQGQLALGEQRVQQGAQKVQQGAQRLAQAGGTKLDQDTLTQMADQYLAGDKSVLTGLGYGNMGASNRAALREEIEKRAKASGMSGRDIATALAEYQGLTAGERSLGTRTATMGMAVSEAKQLIPQVLQTSAAVDRTQYPTLNSLLLAAEKGTGSEEAVRLGIAVNSFINVYARAISPTGTPTVSDKDHARELLEPYWSQGQIAAGMDQIVKELKAASQAPGVVRQEFRESGRTGVSQPQISIGSTPTQKVIRLDKDGNVIP